jgi:excinuclease ABC subunit A
MVDRVMALEEGTRLYLLAPIVRDRKGEYRKEFAELMKQGFQRVKVDGEFYEIADPPHARQEIQARHRRRGGPHRGARGHRRRGWPTAFETALEPRRRIWRSLEFADKPLPRRPGRRLGQQERPMSASPSPRSSPARSPASPSRDRAAAVLLQRPFGACPTCDGLGTSCSSTRPDGARRKRCRCARAPSRPGQGQSRPITRRRWKRCASITASTPSQRRGTTCREGAAGLPSCSARGRSPSSMTTACVLHQVETFEGVIPTSSAAGSETDSAWVREEFERYQNDRPCGPVAATA